MLDTLMIEFSPLLKGADHLLQVESGTLELPVRTEIETVLVEEVKASQ